MYDDDIDVQPTRPIYTGRALRRLTGLDLADAAEANYRRTRDRRWLRRADRLVGAR